MTRTKIPTTAAPAPTTARTTRAASKAKAMPPSTTLTTTTRSRKPLASRANAEASAPKPRKKAAKQAVTTSDDREPIMAYLRIRPHLKSEPSTSQPYLAHLSDSAVKMTDPSLSDPSSSRFRTSTIAPSGSSSVYTFSHVFPPETIQSDFFVKTTLPVVSDVLGGQNALLFTYGVTNSGKTYTVQGGSEPGTAGILPRTLDVIFNSIENLHGDGKFRPVRLNGVEPADPADSLPPRAEPPPELASIFSLDSEDSALNDVDPTSLTLDRNYEYTVWLSYAELYNEKMYDLLDSVSSSGASGSSRTTPHPTSLMRKALALRSSPSTDGSDTPGKYIASLSHHRIRTAAEAKSLLKLGQGYRRVFGTLANAVSSRSHAIVTIKILRTHRAERDNITAVQVSRLTLVDLAGSERTKLTGTSGDRLKEAGSINKSLMVLGQCMEALRNNQRRVASSLAREVTEDTRVDTREIKRRLSVVPFRHSRLTEVLMDYFTGDGGRTVMIVNVNPYDTGYDENAHVMRFAALAKEVYVSPTQAAVQRFPGSIFNAMKPESSTAVPAKKIGGRTTRKVTVETATGPGRKPSEAILEVVEEDAEENAAAREEEDEEPINPLVDALFDEVERLRLQLFECELKCAIIEADTREEVMQEMEERMHQMERVHARRLMSEVERNEMKTDAKIDFLHHSGLFGSPMKSPAKAHHNFTPVAESDEDQASHHSEYETAGQEENEDDEEWAPDSPSLRTKRTKALEQKKAVNPGEMDIDDDDDDDDDLLLKKAKPKRKLGVKHVVTEAEMARTAYTVEKAGSSNVRRLTGRQ
ncbi:hypothetical protein HGRIS_007528 [Hohenbuehelia grisea]|uniref:Kinesin-like protein n=1 Tax=Hohenbuehelia grisea TaxID=104357 RepID=A0ABR3J5K6_9AGAR